MKVKVFPLIVFFLLQSTMVGQTKDFFQDLQ